MLINFMRDILVNMYKWQGYLCLEKYNYLLFRRSRIFQLLSNRRKPTSFRSNFNGWTNTSIFQKSGWPPNRLTKQALKSRGNDILECSPSQYLQDIKREACCNNILKCCFPNYLQLPSLKHLAIIMFMWCMRVSL